MEPEEQSAYDRIFSQAPTKEEAAKQPDRLGVTTLAVMSVSIPLTVAFFICFGNDVVGDSNKFTDFILHFSFWFNLIVIPAMLGVNVYGMFHSLDNKTGQPVNRDWCRRGLWFPLASIPVVLVGIILVKLFGG
jgi:hypothetical protein